MHLKHYQILLLINTGGSDNYKIGDDSIYREGGSENTPGCFISTLK